MKTDHRIRPEPHDPALEDPSLIIYHPVRTLGDDLVVTNGDQTDTIVEAGDFRAGCMARAYEPDAPNFTPRISAIVHPDGSFEMSILKHQENGRCLREFFSPTRGADEGTAMGFISVSGRRQPRCRRSRASRSRCPCLEPEALWAALNADNKVSLYANVNGEVTIFNKNL